MKVPTLHVTKTVFDNGLTLLVLESHHMPIVTSTIWYHVGSANETEGTTGISHFLEHLMFKGTQKYPKGMIDQLTAAHGGHNNAGTIYDYTMYYFTFASDRWTIALEIEADRMQHSQFAHDEIEAERKVVIEELKQQQDSPWGNVGIQLEAAMFPNHPYHHTPIGFREDLEQISRDRLLEYYQAYYVPNNATLVIVGDVHTQDVIQNIQELFASIPAGNSLLSPICQPMGQEGEQRFELIQDTNLARVQMGFHASTLADDDNYVLDVIDHVLSHGKSSRLYQRLVEQEQLVTFVDTCNHPRKLSGVFYAFAELCPGIEPEHVETVLDEEIARLHSEPLSFEELEKIQHVIAADFMFEKETTTGLVHALGEYESLCTYEYMHTYLDRIAHISPEDVMRVAGTYLVEHNRTIGWTLPEHPERAATMADIVEKSVPPPATDMVFHRPNCTPGFLPSAKPVESSESGIPGPSQGQSFLSQHTPSFQYSRWTLDNGLTVLFLEQHHLPIVAIEAFVDAGQRYESDEKAGVAALTGRLLEEGTARRSALDIAQTIESVGGTLRTRSRGASLQVLSQDMPLALDLLSDMLMNSVFAPKALEKERGRLLATLASDEDNPALVAYNLFHEMVYGPHPYHRPQKGYKQTVQALAQTDILDYYTTYFIPNNTILAIVGDVSATDVIDRIQEYFGTWNARPLSPSSPCIIPKPEGCVSKHLYREREQAHIYLGHIGITRTNPDYYALLTMDHILGTGPGFTDRISRRLRDEQGLAYTVYANIALSAETEPGTFMAYIGTSPENTRLAIDGFLDEMQRIQTECVSQEELMLTQNYLTGSYLFYFETNTQLARYLLHTERFQLGDDFLQRYPRIIQGVTNDDVSRVARRYLDPENYYVAMVGP